MKQPKQLTLGIDLRDDATFSNFFSGDNDNAVAQLHQFCNGGNEFFIYLWGEKGVGRSHLLQACYHRFSEQNLSAIYVPLKQYREWTPKLLEDLEQIDCICLDDIDAIAQQRAWEEAIFHCFNRSRQNHKYLLVAAECVPKKLTYSLADLQSRMSSGLVLEIHGLTDEQIKIALQLRAKQRGIDLSEVVIDFLLRRFPRNMGVLFQLMTKLEQAALIEQRRLTVPFIKSICLNEKD